MSASVQRNQSLDVLRCIAILLVLGLHLPHYRVWGRLGWIGVDLFFVLSGFLISGLLFQEYKNTGSINFKRFLIRRGLKIYPSFYLLIGMVAVFSLFLSSASLRRQAWVSAIFAQSYYYPPNTGHALLNHTWSLAVEEHFYVLLPLLLMVMIALRRGSKDPFRAIPWIFVFLVVVCFLARQFTLWPDTPAAMTHMRLDSLFAGVVLGYLYHFQRNRFDLLTGNYALILAALAIIPTALLPQNNHMLQSTGLTLLLLGFSFLVAWAVVRTPTSFIGSVLAKIAAKIGFYSYSVYLWHRALVYVFVRPSQTSYSAVTFWAYIVSSIIAGIAMAHLVEMPYLALREKLFPSVAPAPQLSAPAEKTPGVRVSSPSGPSGSASAPSLAVGAQDSSSI